MGEMAATLAHELNQPLAAIMNNANAARRMIDAGATADPDDVRVTIGDIVADAGRAGEIVRRVRGLVKREAPVLGPVDLNDIVDEVLHLVHADIAGSGISVQLELAPGLPKIRSDRIELQEVLLNLLVNAVDALKQVAGERVLTVRTKAAPGGGVQVIGGKDTTTWLIIPLPRGKNQIKSVIGRSLYHKESPPWICRME